MERDTHRWMGLSEHQRPETVSASAHGRIHGNLTLSSVRLSGSLVLLVYGPIRGFFSFPSPQKIYSYMSRLFIYFTMWRRLPSSGRCVALAPGCVSAGYVRADEAVVWRGVKMMNRAADYKGNSESVACNLFALHCHYYISRIENGRIKISPIELHVRQWLWYVFFIFTEYSSSSSSSPSPSLPSPTVYPEHIIGFDRRQRIQRL